MIPFCPSILPPHFPVFEKPGLSREQTVQDGAARPDMLSGEDISSIPLPSTSPVAHGIPVKTTVMSQQEKVVQSGGQGEVAPSNVEPSRCGQEPLSVSGRPGIESQLSPDQMAAARALFAD